LTTATERLQTLPEAGGALAGTITQHLPDAPRLRGSVEAEDPVRTADPAAVEADLRAGIDGLDRFGAAPDRVRGQATPGLGLLRHGRTAEAAPLPHAARATFGEVRAAAWLQELEASLVRVA
jgi:hypothetical protein